MRTGAFIKQLACVLLVGALAAGSAQAGWRDGNSKAATEAQSCVRERSEMRRNHFELIKHDRDITVHQGVRTVDGSLAGCVSCHANKDDQGKHIPVNASGQFCAGCHQYTGVSFDCFTCHATTPTSAGN